jgi:hypothetical protein
MSQGNTPQLDLQGELDRLAQQDEQVQPTKKPRTQKIVRINSKLVTPPSAATPSILRVRRPVNEIERLPPIINSQEETSPTPPLSPRIPANRSNSVSASAASANRSNSVSASAASANHSNSVSASAAAANSTIRTPVLKRAKARMFSQIQGGKHRKRSHRKIRRTQNKRKHRKTRRTRNKRKNRRTCRR